MAFIAMSLKKDDIMKDESETTRTMKEMAYTKAREKYVQLCDKLFYMESGDEYNKTAKERDKALHELNVAMAKLRGWEDYE